MLTFFFDQDRDGSISFGEVIRHLRGPKAMLEISSKRAASIATAFLDSDGDESGGREVGHGGIPDKLRISICSTASRHARRAKDDSDVIDLESVEQLRLRLRQACTTFKGIKPNKIFDRWDRNGDGDMSREEMRAGMERFSVATCSASGTCSITFSRTWMLTRVASLSDPSFATLS